MASPKSVTIFGASWCKEGSALYAESEKLGALLASSGFKIVNGGYSGTMEGSARGAATVEGSEREGVIVPQLFVRRTGGNEYLSKVTETPTLLTRIEAMVDASPYFVIMNGTLGTLTEACIIWNIAALTNEFGMPTPLILLYRDPWEKALTAMAEALNIPASYRARLRYIDSAEEAVAAINEEHAKREAAAAAGTAAVAAASTESSGSDGASVGGAGAM